MSKPVGPYSPTYRAGDWLIVSGQVGIDGGRLVADDTLGQARQALANLKGLLEANGSSMDAVAKTTVFLVDMSEFAAMNEVYVAAFGDHRPARSAVAVAALPIGARFEVEAWAWMGE
jgi:2-iminobutanoate/2-iminopropanoate deaminase